MFASISALRSAATRCAQGFDPSVLAPADAARAVEEWAAIEHLAAAAKASAAARVAASSAWKASGAPTAADWLAHTTGTTASRAREQLSTAEKLAALDATAAAARSGSISPSQAAAIAEAAAADPAAEHRLLDAARAESLAELRQRCARTRAAADPDPETTRRRIHAARGLRRWGSADGTQHLHASGPADLLARVDTALRPLTERAFAKARAAEQHESHEAYAFDALVALADEGGSTASPTRTRTRHRAVIRVDLDALVRGASEGDETCEIAGLGPIELARAP